MARRRKNPEVIDAEIVEPPGALVKSAPPRPTVIVVQAEPLRQEPARSTLKPDLADELLGEFVDALRRAIRRW